MQVSGSEGERSVEGRGEVARLHVRKKRERERERERGRME